LTRVPGSSDYFQGGVIAYSNDLKRRLLGVRAETLSRHGAVSPQCAGEMAQGARARCGADIALAITGIAGPSGGTREKPLGLVYIALSAVGKTVTKELKLSGGRDVVRARAVSHALDLLRTFCKLRAHGTQNREA
jgi:nicotinamide-nucleotide amidase